VLPVATIYVATGLLCSADSAPCGLIDYSVAGSVTTTAQKHFDLRQLAADA